MGFSKCIIPSVHLKVFGRAIQSLSKLGDELYFDPLEDGLSLRTVNSNRSAYACFQFSPSFFASYITTDNNENGDDEDGFRCKLTMKSIMKVFRSLSTIDKTVEKCKITHNLQEDKLTFQLYCRHGIVKTHNLSYMDCETLQAVFTKDMCPNKLTACPKLLCDAVLNFQVNQEEVTFLLRPDFLALKNYVGDEPNPAKVVHTELTLSPDEFDHFQVGVDTDITFCLKEFRAILAFCDLTNLPMNIHIESPGRPVTFSITSDLSFEGNFVLATLAEPEDVGDRQKQHPVNKTSHDKNRKSTSSVHQTSHISNKKQQRTKCRETFQEEDRMEDETEMEINDTTIIDTNYVKKSSLTHLNHNNITKQLSTSNTNNFESNITEKDGHNEKLNNLPNQQKVNNDSLLHQKDTGSSRSQSKTLSVQKENGFYVSASEGSQSHTEMEKSRGLTTNAMLSVLDDDPAEMSQIIPLRDENLPFFSIQEPSSLINDGDNDEEDDEDQICATPPKKKFRSLFFNTQSSTQSTIASQEKPAVLCPDTDSD